MISQNNFTNLNFNPLTLAQLQAKAPSIFTTEKAERTSDKYTHIHTLDVIKGLQKEGFYPVLATQNGSRLPNKKFFTKHMIRFRHASQDQAINKLGQLFNEVVLINSHDGLSSYRLMAGLFRVLCLNGMVAGKTLDEVRVRHQGDIIGNVIEGSYRVLDNSKKMLTSAQDMSRIELTSDERQIFAESVHQLRFDGDKSSLPEAIKPEQFLRARRYQETGKTDLWNTLNVTQENLIKGGLTGWTRDERGYAKRTTTRAIKSIDQNTALNRAIWTLAEKMKELKG